MDQLGHEAGAEKKKATGGDNGGGALARGGHFSRLRVSGTAIIWRDPIRIYRGIGRWQIQTILPVRAAS
jgi:hypothetical protein